MRSLCLLIGVLVVVPGCGNDITWVRAGLKKLDSCDAAVDQAIGTAVSSMNQRLNDNLKSALATLTSGEGTCWEDVYDDFDRGEGIGSAPPDSGGPQPSPGGDPGSQPDAPAEPEPGAGETSGTNNQVAGVDEADFVKNDNKYLYIVNDGKLRIIDAWPPEEASTLSEVAIEGTPKKLFVTEGKALVYSSLVTEDDSGAYGSWYEPKECTYGYSCSFTGDGHPTKLSIFDISDRGVPTLTREVRMSGSLVSARRIGSAVHSVLSDQSPRFDGLSYYVYIDWCENPTAMDIVKAYEELRKENLAVIKSYRDTTWLPVGEDSLHGTIGAECSNFFASNLADGASFTSVLSVDMDNDDLEGVITSIISGPGAVYSSADALYVAVPHERQYNMWYEDVEEDEVSTIHKFALSNQAATSEYVGSGVVKGKVLNQFAMDEYEGHLRIATTTGHAPQPDTHSTMTVLAEQGDTLVPIGVVDNIAPTEDIRSVRFAGERGFVVTFKKTDPLFLFDLSDPSNPSILSELKIPGFSTYMHLMDENHLLTIGYDADDQGSFAWFTGVMLQIFDVSNPLDPILKHKHIIGTRGSSSEALTNHLAFNYFASKDMLAIPMTVCEDSSGGGGYGQTMSFSGLMVFDVTAADGFGEHGRVEHPVGEGIDCSNWWTNATSQVKRSVFFDDYIYSISTSLVKANHLDDLAVDVSTVPIEDTP